MHKYWNKIHNKNILFRFESYQGVRQSNFLQLYTTRSFSCSILCFLKNFELCSLKNQNVNRVCDRIPYNPSNNRKIRIFNFKKYKYRREI